MTDTVKTNPARWAAMALLVTSLQAGAQTTPKFADAQASDPATLGWMVGSPPPADKLVQFADGTFGSFLRYAWSFSNYRQFVPTSNVARDTGPVSVLPVAARQDIDGVTFQVIGSGETMSWAHSQIWDHTRAGSVIPRPPGYEGPKSFYEFLQTVRKEGVHGQAFAYKTVNSDALGWVIRRATGKSIGENLQDRIWSKPVSNRMPISRSTPRATNSPAAD